jgi:apocytochrome f
MEKKLILNVGGILILPKGFKLAPKNQISEEVKAKNKGVFISPYSTEFDNILVVGPIAGKTHQELIFPVVAPDPEKNSDVKYLTYPIYAGGNRGRGQVYPTGEKSNVNIFGANKLVKLQKLQLQKKVNQYCNCKFKWYKNISSCSSWINLIVKQGDTVKLIKH